MDDKQTIFEAWAKPNGDWSDWVKPVLFAHLPRRLPDVEIVTWHDMTWVPPASQRCAIVVELPGPESVALGLELAQVGYQPLPLFNACPAPEIDELFLATEEKKGPFSLVDVDSILASLVSGAERLRSLAVPANAPPAFLLDVLRKSPLQPIRAGLFDNRSVVFATDFPSAHTLMDRGILEAIVVVKEGQSLQDDLDHVLRTWVRDGLSLRLKRLNQAGQPTPLELPRPSVIFGLWIRLASKFGLRRNPQGGYGEFVPEASGG